MRSLHLDLCLLTIALVLAAPQVARSEDFRQSAQTLWFDPNSPFRSSISFEMSGIGERQAAEVLRKTLGSDARDIQVHTVSLDERGAPILEVETGAMSFPAVEKLQQGWQALEKLGGLGKAGGRVPELHVRILDSLEPSERASFYLNLVRNLTRSEHRSQISLNQTAVPLLETARPGGGVLRYSPGLLRKFEDPTYQPNLVTFFEDIFYRQTAERLGLDAKGAWSIPIADIKKSVLASSPSRVIEALDETPRHILAALASSFTGDPMTGYLEKAGIRAGTGVEIATFRNTGRIAEAVRESLGVANVTRQYGAFDHDRLIFQTTGIAEESLAALRTAESQSAQSGAPVIFRYFLTDPHKPWPKAAEGYAPLAEVHSTFAGVVAGRIPVDVVGQKPLIIPGKSVVYHHRTFHRDNVLGKYNPGIINGNIAQFIGMNKYAEFKYWDKFTPGVMPQTFLLDQIQLQGTSAATLKKKLDARFPKGWVLKGTNESNTGLALVTDSKDLGKLVSDYKSGDFDRFREKVLVDLKGRDEDEIFAKLQEHPNYLGWKISAYIDNPKTAIVQEKLPLDREYRIEAIGGKVLGGESTIDRYYIDYKLKGMPFERSTDKMYRDVEEFAQREILDKLPRELAATPHAFDIASLKTGGYAMVESNLGPESGWPQIEPGSSKVLNAFLKKYPEMAEKGEIVAKGYSDEVQMKMIRDWIREWKLDPKIHFPANYRLTETRFEPAYPRVAPTSAYFQIAPPYKSTSSDGAGGCNVMWQRLARGMKPSK